MMVNRNWVLTLLRLVLAVVVAGLLLNTPAKAMSGDCHTADVAVHTKLASPQQGSEDADHHHKKPLKGKLCCASACAVCVAAIPSPASMAWNADTAPSYFLDTLVGLSGQDAPAVFKPPRSIPL